MDRNNYVAQADHRALLRDYWSSSSIAAAQDQAGKHRKRWAALSAPSSSWTPAYFPSFGFAPALARAPAVSAKLRRGFYGPVYGHSAGSGGRRNCCCSSGKVSMAYGLGTLNLQRQFSEDSGFSSCSSSASSVADEFETPRCHTWSGCQTSSRLTRTSNWSAQSDTVASVLAAGVSDSEETDCCESDEEGTNNIFKSHGMKFKANQSGNICSKQSPLPSTLSVASLPKDETTQEELQLHHLERDILDLDSNLRTNFPLRATELPDRNLPLFLQNRSQYHRLGKFGTVETLPFINCKKQCGFSFPVPPRETTN